MCFQAYLLVHNFRDPDDYQQKYSTGGLQEVRNIEDQAKMAVTVLKGNIGVLVALRNFYHNSLGENDDFSLKEHCIGDLLSFAHQIDNFIDESKTHLAQGQLIAKIIAARKSIVCVS